MSASLTAKQATVRNRIADCFSSCTSGDSRLAGRYEAQLSRYRYRWRRAGNLVSINQAW